MNNQSELSGEEKAKPRFLLTGVQIGITRDEGKTVERGDRVTFTEQQSGSCGGGSLNGGEKTASKAKKLGTYQINES